MNLMQTVERAAARLDAAGVSFGHGTTNAFDEAAWLVLWRLGLPLDTLDDEALRPLTDAEAAAVDTLLDQRIETRRPAAYLTGGTWGDQSAGLANDEQLGAVMRLATRPLHGEDWNIHTGFSGSALFRPQESNKDQPGDKDDQCAQHASLPHARQPSLKHWAE